MDINKFRELLEVWRAKGCKSKGADCNCNHQDGPAFIEGPDGKRKYFCHVGCALLQFDNKSMKKIVEYQFNNEGHYEKLRRELDHYKHK